MKSARMTAQFTSRMTSLLKKRWPASLAFSALVLLISLPMAHAAPTVELIRAADGHGPGASVKIAEAELTEAVKERKTVPELEKILAMKALTAIGFTPDQNSITIVASPTSRLQPVQQTIQTLQFVDMKSNIAIICHAGKINPPNLFNKGLWGVGVWNCEHGDHSPVNFASMRPRP